MRKLLTFSFLVFAAACGEDAVDRPPAIAVEPLTTPEDTAAAFTIAVDDDRPDVTIAVSRPRHGRIEGAGSSWTYTPDADFHGDDGATITASDGVYTTTARLAIAVGAADDAPVARPDAFAANQDVPLRIITAALTGNDVDPDGDPLTVIAVTAGREGAVAMDGDQVVLTLPAGWNGVTRFSYTVAAGGRIATGEVTVHVGAANQAPIAAADQVATDEDTYVNVAAAALLANDGDPNGETLTITSVGGASGGTVALAGDHVVFMPAADWHGRGHFRYTISDGAAPASGEVAVEVASINDAPVAAADHGVTGEDEAIAITAAELLANDRDVDGDALVVTAAGGAYGGDVELTDGVVHFRPGADFHGAAGFTYTITDGEAAVAGAYQLDVAAINDAPIAAPVAVATLEDMDADVALAATDADGDPLTYTIVAPPSHGALTGAGHVLRYTPDSDFHGADAFSYQAGDGRALSAVAAVTITIGSVPECGDGEISPALNGMPDGGEACDDGNLVAGDGCDAACGLEPGYVTTAPAMISGALPCSTSTGHTVALDTAGAVHVVMRCGADVYLATSHDRGVTFAAPIALGITAATDVAIATGGPGVAYVAAATDGEVVFTASDDGGATWSAPIDLGLAPLGLISLDADGDDVYLGAAGLTAITVRHSATRGAGPWSMISVAMQPDSVELIHDDRGGALLVCSATPSFHVRVSTDLGLSFGAEVNPAGLAVGSRWATGGGSIFAVGSATGSDRITIIDADNKASSTVLTGLPADLLPDQRALAADAAGTAYVATTRAGGGLQLDRLLRAAPGFDAPRTIAPDGSYPGVTALPSGTGVAVVYTAGAAVYATIQTY